MITGFKFENCYAFNNLVEINLRADMRTKKFPCNVANISDNLNVMKSIAIYGPNNTGKTSLINCIKEMKRTLLKKEIGLMANIFTDSSVCYEAMSFVFDGNEYLYEYKFNCKTRSYLYEKMVKIVRDVHNNEKEEVIFIKDNINDIYECPQDLKLQEVLNIASSDNILIYTVQVEKFEILQRIKTILTSVANSIEIVDMNRIPIDKTIEILKNKGKETEKIVSFIKNADIYLDDYKYVEELKFEINGKEADEKVLKNQNIMDQIRLVSVYKGKEVPSIMFDSIGTRKIAALASYVIDAIESGKTLIIDELDSSLHFKITRAIISMFNNDINKCAQLIATLHDISLLDCQKMFRKEQIWFTDKDDKGTEVYSLKEFSYEQTGIRDTSDIQEKYSKGVFGAIPDPDLISTLLEVNTDEEK